MNPALPECQPVPDCKLNPVLPGCPLGPIAKPTVDTATYKNGVLSILLKCPVRFKPSCSSVSTPVTKNGLKKVKRGRKFRMVPRGLSMAVKQIRKSIVSNRFVKVTYLVKPAFRPQVEAMTKVDAKRLFVKQVVRSRKVGKRKNRKASTIFHTYKVRVQA